MKVMTVFGTRPEIIRLSHVIPRLDRFCEHVIVHTGQNYDTGLSDIFFDELRVRRPDLHLGVKATSFATQACQIIERIDDAFERERPDRLVILGDTNSGLAAVPAARRGIPIFHMEAGNRCYDNRVPEEINRRIIDHCSTVLMPYTERSKENLVREGIDRERIFVTGNPINEVLRAYTEGVDAAPVLDSYGVQAGGYFLVTLHRSENVDEPERLDRILRGLQAVVEKYDRPMLVSLHPRTASRMEAFGLTVASQRVRLLKPLGFLGFVALERHALAVLSDSGTVQEECAILGVPNVTLRDVTERPETIERGTNVLAGSNPAALLRALDVALELGGDWSAPPEYCVENVSRTVAKIVLGFTSIRRHDAVGVGG
jgi:UDP-N-acetylglucosamine 2-epimerase (non-hydrolysing)